VNEPLFAVWTLFREAPRWWLARGCPPTVLAEPRAMRVSLLLGLMGLAAGWLSAMLLHVNSLVQFHQEALFWMPGALFGGVVLLPLSRWIGRGWIASVLSIPVSVGAYWAAVYVDLKIDPPLGASSVSEPVAGALAGMAGAGILCVWLMPIRRLRALPVHFVLSLAVGVAGGLITGFAIGTNHGSTGYSALDLVLELGVETAMFAPFQALAAFALGSRLWWERSPHAPREESVGKTS